MEGKVDPFELEHIEGCRTRKEHVRRLPAIAGEEVVSWMESLRLFCLQIFSPPLPQFRAWLPSTSLGLEQEGRGRPCQTARATVFHAKFGFVSAKLLNFLPYVLANFCCFWNVCLHFTLLYSTPHISSIVVASAPPDTAIFPPFTAEPTAGPAGPPHC